jgi:hypothetical protein
MKCNYSTVFELSIHVISNNLFLRSAQAEAIASGDAYLRNKLFEITWIDNSNTVE